jgi:hypothetical protein
MEENEDFSLCFHNAQVIYCNPTKSSHPFKNLETRLYSGYEVLREWTVPTASVLFRTRFLKLISNEQGLNNKNYLYGDIILILNMNEHGYLFGMAEVMSVYRRHEGGFTHSNKKDLMRWKKSIKHHKEIKKNFGGKYVDTGTIILSRQYMRLAKEQIIKLDKAFFKSFYVSLKYSPKLFVSNFLKTFFSRTAIKKNILMVYKLMLSKG